MSFSSPEIYEQDFMPPHSLIVRDSGANEVMSFMSERENTELAWISMRSQGTFRSFILDTPGLEAPRYPIVFQPGYLRAQYEDLSVSWKSGTGSNLEWYNRIGLKLQGLLDERVLLITRQLLEYTIPPMLKPELDSFILNGVELKFLGDSQGSSSEAA